MPTALEIKQAKRIKELEAENRSLRALVEKLEARIRVLEDLLKSKKTPTPPAGPLEPPKAVPTDGCKKKRKKRGRKKGHSRPSSHW